MRAAATSRNVDGSDVAAVVRPGVSSPAVTMTAARHRRRLYLRAHPFDAMKAPDLIYIEQAARASPAAASGQLVIRQSTTIRHH